MSVAPINISGIISGMDTNSIVTQLMALDQQGLTRLNAQKSTLQARQQAYQDLNTRVLALRTAAYGLSTSSGVMAFKAVAADTDMMAGTATSAATPGSYSVEILNRSTVSVLNGTSDSGSAIDPNAALNSTSAFGSSFTAGTFTINGKQFTVAASDSLNDVLAKITDPVTGVSGLSASFNAGTDKVTLSSATNPLVIGTGGDTSNVLSLLKVNTNSTGGAPYTSTSSAELGHLSTTGAMNAAGANGARSRTAITNGGGTGQFTVNGKTITFDAGVDSISTVLSRITSSDAGVTASYDATNDRVVLANKTGGATGITVADVSGNFASALGLTGSVTLGTNAKIKINGGSTIQSNDDVFTSTETGVTGLTLNLTADTGTTTVSVSTDTSAVAAKLNSFMTAYNTVMSFIQDKTGVTGTGKNAVAGPLHGMQDVLDLKYQLRSTLSQMVSGLSSGPSTLAGIGLGATGQSPTLSLDSTKLDDALTNHAENVKAILADSTNGVMTKMTSFIDSKTLYGDGPLAQESGRIEPSITRLDQSIQQYQKNMAAKQARLMAQFSAMEKTLAQLQQGTATLLNSLSTTA